MLLLRLLFLASPVALGANLVPVLSPTQDAWHALGRLVLVARGFTLLAAPVCFALPPRVNAAAQAAGVAVSMWMVRGACSTGYLYLPSARSSLARCMRGWVGKWVGGWVDRRVGGLPPVRVACMQRVWLAYLEGRRAA